MKVPVRRRGEIVAYALVDDADRALVEGRRWVLTSHGYVSTSVDHRARAYLHRLVLGLIPGDGLQADHISGDRLDNRRENLRAVTPLQNGQNRGGRRGSSSRYRGVSWLPRRRRWHARVQIDGVLHILGDHATEEDAALVVREFLARHAPFSSEAREA